VGNKSAIPAPKLLPYSLWATPVGMKLISSQRYFGSGFTSF